MIGRGDVVRVGSSRRVVLSVDPDGVPRVGMNLSQRGRGRRAPAAALLVTRELANATHALQAARRRHEHSYPDMAQTALRLALRHLRAANVRGDDNVNALRSVTLDAHYTKERLTHAL